MKVVQTNISQVNLYNELNLDSIKIDETLVFDIFIKRDKNYVIIIEAGTMLSQELYNKLQKQDKLFIAKKDAKNQEFTCQSLYIYVKHNKNDLKKSLNFLYDASIDVFSDFLNSKDNVIEIPCIKEIVKSIVFLLKNNPNFLKETIPHFANDYKLAYHSLHVSIYAICIAHYINLTDNQLKQIGLAGLMHDTGIKDVDDSIKNKDSELSIKELEAVQKHSTYSSNIAIKNNITDPYILDGIRRHHECYDGTGYPDRLHGKDISIFASILAISDVFDALTSDRPHRKDKSTFDALKIMMKDDSMVGKFNQEYLKIFLQSFLK